MKLQSNLVIEAFSFDCHIGCTAEEREIAQPMKVKIKLYFSDPPQACTNDSLENTICYAEICKQVLNTTQHRYFETVEYLAMELYNKIRSIVSPDNKISLALQKTKPPVVGLTGGVWFEISECT